MSGDQAQLLDGLNPVGIVVFLFMAGAEIDVAGVSRRARDAVSVALGFAMNARGAMEIVLALAALMQPA